MGFGVWGVGLELWGLQGSGFGDLGLGFGVWGLEFHPRVLLLRPQLTPICLMFGGSGFWIWCSGSGVFRFGVFRFGIWSLEFRVFRLGFSVKGDQVMYTTGVLGGVQEADRRRRN